jgi:hypothetical protein
MLTRDQNIVDIEFQVVWNINDPAQYPVQPGRPEDTIRAVSGIGHARHHRAVGTVAHPEPRPRADRVGPARGGSGHAGQLSGRHQRDPDQL